MMRIIAGTYRGRVLKSLRGHELRPTSGKLRETLFDVLGSAVNHAVFVDCYAGSAAVGLEALSRGVRQVFLIEEDIAAIRLIQENLSRLGAPENVHVVRASARRGLARLERLGVRPDFCFLDPPYAARQECLRTLLWLSESRLMASGGTIVLQHSRKESPELRLGIWNRVRLLAQGSSALSFYRALPQAEDSRGVGDLANSSGAGVDAPRPPGYNRN